MARVGGTGLLVICLLVAAPLWAAKEISVDFDTGNETEWVHEVPSEPEEKSKDGDKKKLQRELTRLRKVLRVQQHLISQQQAAIKELKMDLRRQQNINRGLEQLCRACR